METSADQLSTVDQGNRNERDRNPFYILSMQTFSSTATNASLRRVCTRICIAYRYET